MLASGYIRTHPDPYAQDSLHRQFIAARDRYGIKPLFYTVTEGRILVAAEQKAFLPLGWKPEWDVKAMMDQGAFNDERTCFRGVRKVSPHGSN